jgi:hypothetical protein
MVTLAWWKTQIKLTSRQSKAKCCMKVRCEIGRPLDKWHNVGVNIVNPTLENSFPKAMHTPAQLEHSFSAADN